MIEKINAISKSKKILLIIMILVTITGLLLFIINEQYYAKANMPISNMKYINISSNKIEEKNNNKLIVTRGKLSVTNTITDDVFGISVKSPKLNRVVEIFTCNMLCNRYNYDENCPVVKEWTTTLKSDFIEKDPTCNKVVTTSFYTSQIKTNEKTKLGVFDLDPIFLENLPTEKKVLKLNEKTAKELNLYIVDSTYTTTPPNEEPKAGDIRISFYYAEPIELTILGTQNNNTIKQYERLSGDKISHVSTEELDGTQMLAPLQSDLFIPTYLWHFRIISLLLIISGTTAFTLIYYSNSEKSSAMKTKMLFITTSSITIFTMLIAFIIWKLNNYTNSDDQILSMFIAGSATIFLVCAIIAKPKEKSYGYEKNAFLKEYGEILHNNNNDWENLNNPSNLKQPEVYTRKQSYENPYKKHFNNDQNKK